MSLFIIIALGICTATGFYVLRPFSQTESSSEQVSRIERFVWFFIVLIVAVMLYLKVGDSNALKFEHSDSDSIASQLSKTRDDPASVIEWNELGRSYLLEQKYINAYMAYTEAEKLDTHAGNFDEFSGDLDERLKWLTGLAEARILAQKGGVDNTSNDLIKRALSINPENPKVLWYGGLAAAQFNDLPNAKMYWTKLLALNPPEALRNVVKIRLDAIDQLLTETTASYWELKMNVKLDAELSKVQTAESRVYASIRQLQGQPPLAAHAYPVDALRDTLVLSSNDAISGMSGNRTVNWDEPVYLSLIWSPGGQAIASDNVRLSAELTRSNLESISNYTLAEIK